MANLNNDAECTSNELQSLLLLNLERMDAAVNEEYVENDRRLNWFLLFQAFLFQGYATALQAITGANEHGRQVAHAKALMIIIIFVGLVTTCVTYLSTQAGICAIEKLKGLREERRTGVES